MFFIISFWYLVKINSKLGLRQRFGVLIDQQVHTWIKLNSINHLTLWHNEFIGSEVLAMHKLISKDTFIRDYEQIPKSEDDYVWQLSIIKILLFCERHQGTHVIYGSIHLYRAIVWRDKDCCYIIWQHKGGQGRLRHWQANVTLTLCNPRYIILDANSRAEFILLNAAVQI